MTSFNKRTDEYCDDRLRSGHLTSQESVRTYRFFLDRLAKDVDNRDPSLISHQEIKQTLARWSNPNTYGQARTACNVFYAWLVAEGHAKSNPVDRIQAPRKRPVSKTRLTRAEMRAIMDACRNERDRRAIYLGACAGLRNSEVRLLTGRHFARPGFIWVSEDIAKGGRERYVPIGADLQAVADEIVANVALDELVLPSLRAFDPGINKDQRPTRKPKPMSADGYIGLVARICERAGIDHRVTPHALRHFFGETVTGATGIHNAQHLLGHASIQTTQIYAGKPSLDDLAVAVRNIEFRLPTQIMAVRPAENRTRMNSSQQDFDLSQAFGALLLHLKRQFRPLLFGMSA